MKLEDFKNRQQFTVPENYFEQFAGNMMNMLPKEGAKETKSRTIALPRIARYISYAAIFVVMFAIGATLLINNNTPEYLATEEYYEGEYIDEMLNNYTIDDYTFYCYLTGNDMN